MRSSTVALAGVTGLVAALSLSACAGSSEQIASENAVVAPEVQESDSAAVAVPTTWKMTGEPDEQEGRGRPVMVVKIDNTTSSWPQVGLDEADTVVQEPVEGGATRLAAFFESTRPDVVGPVRSIRTSDIGFVKPIDGTMIASGGSPVALSAARKAKVTVVEEGAPGFYREAGRSAPYNLMVNLKRASRSLSASDPTQPYLDFGDFQAPKGKSAKDLTVGFNGQSSEEWAYSARDGGWARQGGGGDFIATNLIVLKLEVGDAGYLDPAGNPVPELKTNGGGKGWLATGPDLYRIRWSKASDKATWTFTSATGEPLQMPPGQSWISLVPESTGSVAKG